MAINVNNNGASATTSADSAAAVAKAGSKALNADDFMKLLVAQLKNQDPNNPLDTKELVTQLSQLTGVEQLVSIGTQMKSLTTATNGMAANQSAGLIGKTVQGSADSVQLGSTDGVSSAVNLAQNAATATVTVTNAAGKVVQTIPMKNLVAGSQPISWDGFATTGERAPAGTYTFSVDATDAKGNPVGTDMNVAGIVHGVDYSTGSPVLTVTTAAGTTAQVALSNIASITQ